MIRRADWRQAMTDAFDRDRRRFLGNAALTLAAAQFAFNGPAKAETKAKIEVTKAGAHTSFRALKQMDEGQLNVGYVEMGPASGPAVLLLHGWPYDIYS